MMMFLSSKYCLLSVFIFLYLLLVFLMHHFIGNDVNAYKIYVYFILFIETPVCAFFIVSVISDNVDFNERYFLRFLLNISLLQILIVIISITVPGVRDLILQTSRDADLLISISNSHGGMRSFGLASGYTSDLGMVLGIFSMLCISISLKSQNFSKKFFLLGLLFAIGAVINARVGLFPPLFLLLLIVFLFIFNLISVFRLAVGGFFAATIFLIFSYTDFYDEKAFGRLLDMVDEVFSLINGNKVGTFQVLENMHFFPNDRFSFWFGTGMDVFDNKNAMSLLNSDIGYVNDIFLMGLFNVLLVFVLFFTLHFRTFSYISRKFGSLVLFCLISSLFVFYFKGVGLTSNAMTNYLVLITFGLYKLNKLGGIKL
ncbi:hypothetical protein FJQ87_14040 [Shewanella sp. SNU WT4]|uniref:hypothetical protein n=1 Tax=Shewanella sp. SNU WT4 TaxID=2590015 RepID=UPI0011263FB0|nr:hypothetical protein [Shewanella sp. SNU WT4]QDF67641.1 hypothetical protein FJQ87_14040 [Shewanella sp. SNU WT4]